MEFKDRVCCICDKHKRFLGRINGGQKLYCMQCQAKITKEYGQEYWKPCSLQEFLEASCVSMGKKRDRSSNMFSNIRKTLQQSDDEC